MSALQVAMVWLFAVGHFGGVLAADVADTPTPRSNFYVPATAPCLSGDLYGLKIGKPFENERIEILWERVVPMNEARLIAFQPKQGKEVGVEYRAMVEPRANLVVMIQLTVWLENESLAESQMDTLKRLYAVSGFPSDRSGCSRC
jgi:hypothetical protein